MPELPEVETVRAGLSKYVIGRRILSGESFHRRAIKPSSISSLSMIAGVKIKSVNRRGKFLWFDLDHELTLVAHLGMSGQLIFSSEKMPNQRHLRAKLTLQNSGFGRRKIGDKDEIRFIDQRTFGWLSLEESDAGIPSSVAHIAYDPFDENFEIKKVISNISSRKTAIKPAILNQVIVSGIGNIYADEALWRAKIHPEENCQDLSSSQIKNLLISAKAVMKSSIAAGGTSFDEQYKNVNGESGYFSRSLRVYGREGQPCSRCATLIRRIAFANRSSHFCPRCQR